jgi:hypothetical protein
MPVLIDNPGGYILGSSSCVSNWFQATLLYVSMCSDLCLWPGISSALAAILSEHGVSGIAVSSLRTPRLVSTSPTTSPIAALLGPLIAGVLGIDVSALTASAPGMYFFRLHGPSGLHVLTGG